MENKLSLLFSNQKPHSQQSSPLAVHSGLHKKRTPRSSAPASKPQLSRKQALQASHPQACSRVEKANSQIPSPTASCHSSPQSASSSFPNKQNKTSSQFRME